MRLTYAQRSVLYKAGTLALGTHKRAKYRPALKLLELELVRVAGTVKVRDHPPGRAVREHELVRYVATEKGMEWLHSRGLLEGDSSKGDAPG
jgi:hypothetical protein